MIKRIIFICENPVDELYYKRRGIDLLKRMGFAVEVWDCTPIICPELISNSSYPPFIFEGLTVFYEKAKVIHRIINLKRSDFIIILLFYTPDDLWVYQTISKTSIEYAVISVASFPTKELTGIPLLSYRFKKLFPITASKLKRIMMQRLPFRCIKVKPARLIIGSSMMAIKDIKYPINENTEIVLTHDFDYDNFMELECDLKYKKGKGKFIVFIDQYLPFHPDLISLGLNIDSQAQKYYYSLKKFFDYLVKLTGMKLLIAASPRSDYEIRPNYFGEYEIIKGKSALLVKESSLVLMHYSNAGKNFGVLFRKPILFLTTDVLEKSFVGTNIRSLSNRLGKTPVNVDELEKIDFCFDLFEIFKINENLYQRVQDDFIKSPQTPEKLFWQIVGEKLRTL